jgi:hypothetical protein
MNFKEAFADDLQKAYFDLDDFGTTHTIDGVECDIVMTEIKAEDSVRSYRLSKNALNPKESAINKHGYVIYVRDTDLRKKVTVNSMITLDGKKFFVYEVSHTDGIYTLTVGINAV